MTNLEKETLEAQGIKVTICPPRKAKGSSGQNFSLIKTKFHQKSRRPHKHSAPSTKVVSGIYGDDKQLKGDLQHRGLNPLAAQENKAIENY